MSAYGTFRIVRHYIGAGKPKRVIRKGLTLDEARKWVQDPETSSNTASGYAARKLTEKHGQWFDGYEPEDLANSSSD